MFKARKEAGKLLALAHLKDKAPVVVGLPRDGVPVAFEVANALNAPLDLDLVRKIGVPGQPELTVGAVIDGDNLHFIATATSPRSWAPKRTTSSEKPGRNGKRSRNGDAVVLVDECVRL